MDKYIPGMGAGSMQPACSMDLGKTIQSLLCLWFLIFKMSSSAHLTLLLQSLREVMHGRNLAPDA